MSLAVIYSRGRSGIEAPLVTVEVHVANGLPALNIVGLPETAVKESKDRVRGAILNSKFEFPMQRITVNLAPADLPKEGGRFDLAIALGILAASGQIPIAHLHHYECVGELSLGGELRAINGVLPVAIQARNNDRKLILPKENTAEAALIKGIEIIPAMHLLEVCSHLAGQNLIQVEFQQEEQGVPAADIDFADVHGQYHVKRAFEIAAAGAHNLIMLGPPGTGKSMLASRLPTILPQLTEQQAQETAAIASISDQGLDVANWLKPPYRAPHHTASAAALVGGGSNPRPGEISLAHNGTLFLDELPEFDRKALEVLREPLEAGRITISRAARQADYPARFQLVAAMNPCPCGWLGHLSGKCRCTPEQVARYRSRLSGPLLDRIDLHMEVPALADSDLLASQSGEASAEVRQRVCAARDRQLARQGKPNAALGTGEIDTHCPVDAPGAALLKQAIARLNLSARAYHRVLKLARSLADLAGEADIAARHIAEAVQYRRGL